MLGLSLVGQARISAVVLVILVADKIVGDNMKIQQRKEKLCRVVGEMVTIFHLIMAGSLVGERIAGADKII